jgi:hypothetical protein
LSGLRETIGSSGYAAFCRWSCIAPSPVGTFFQRPILQQRLGQRFFEPGRLAVQFLNLVTNGLAGGVSGQTLLAGFQEFLRPTVVQVVVDAFFAAQLGEYLGPPSRRCLFSLPS